MILKETILSAFTERGTLLKWLKKVESALNNGVLSSISVEQVSDTQVKLRFTFENGDYIESPVLTLPRGEAGVGFNDAKEISINDGAVNITADDNGVNIEASFEVAVGEEILAIPSTMYFPLKGSESIVIDVDESGDFIEVHLDASIASKIERSLVTPMNAPSSINIVGVDASNAQTMIKIGNGLIVEDGVLKLAQMNTIKAGTYRFNDTLDFTSLENNSSNEFNINFTYPEDMSSVGMGEVVLECDKLTVALDYAGYYIEFNVTNSTPSLGDFPVVWRVYREWEENHWFDSDLNFTHSKIITVTADTEVTTAVAEWFDDNTVKVT